ncbi:MAG: hypothetical protein IJF11_04640 [Clostridia bacterium]|nr:hypothetical protein [Clostridia bacterium]
MGRELFPAHTLFLAGGAIQIRSRTSKWSYWTTFFDEPRDSRCIALGIVLYEIRNGGIK